MVPPPPSLDGVRLKLARAREHQSTAQATAEAFRDRFRAEPYPVVSEIDPQTGEKRWRIDRDLPAPPPELAIIVGDALYNFRSALDHLVWQLVLANGEEPTRDNAFLIAATTQSFGRWADTRFKGVAAPARAVLDWYQPCFAHHRYWGPDLLLLETLGNIDKHRRLNVLTASTSGGFWHPPLPAHTTGAFILEGPLERGAVIASVPQDYAHVEFDPVPDVAICEAAVPTNESVDSLMMGIESVVSHIIDALVPYV